jgi:hypothetical protein
LWRIGYAYNWLTSVLEGEYIMRFLRILSISIAWSHWLVVGFTLYPYFLTTQSMCLSQSGTPSITASAEQGTVSGMKADPLVLNCVQEDIPGIKTELGKRPMERNRPAGEYAFPLNITTAFGRLEVVKYLLNLCVPGVFSQSRQLHDSN